MEYLKSIADQGGPAGFTVDLAAAGGVTLTGSGAVTVLEPGFWDIERRMKAMDQAGVQLQALSLAAPMPHTAEGRRGVDLARIYNDAVIATHAKYPTRFAGCLALPLHDVNMSSVEIDRVGSQRAMRAVSFPTNIGGKELSDKSLFPLYRKLQALNQPILIHPHPGVAGLDRMTSYSLPALVGDPFEVTIAASHLVFGGVLDSFPRLSVLLPYAGGAFPFLYGRVQRGQQVLPELKNVAERPVADYLKRFYYDSLTHSPEALKYLVDLVGADRVMLGSDCCFTLGDDHPRDIVSRLAIPPADRDRIMFGNAQRFLQLD
jgi:aminocarboxymuconate-semialdehyde decarboxylase